MELHLIGALAGGGGEQGPASSSATITSSATAPRYEYDDEVFGSSAVPAYDDDLLGAGPFLNPVTPQTHAKVDKPSRDEIDKVLALLEYHKMASVPAFFDDYTTTSNSCTKCSTMGFPYTNVSSVHSAAQGVRPNAQPKLRWRAYFRQVAGHPHR